MMHADAGTQPLLQPELHSAQRYDDGQLPSEEPLSVSDRRYRRRPWCSANRGLVHMDELPSQ